LRLFAAWICGVLIASGQQRAPKDAAEWAALGVAHAGRGEYALAEEPFHQACLLKPDLPDACLFYGRVLYLQDRFDAALPVLRKAIGREPRSAQLHRIEALCLEALGRAAEAETAFRDAVRLERGSHPDEDPAIDYGVFLYRQGRAGEALVPLESASQRHPDSARAQLELGCVLLSLGRAGDAAARLEHAVAINPALPRAHLLLGRAYQQLGKTELAARELDKGSRAVR
jgi:Tfp pilus assembly protein PilF